MPKYNLNALGHEEFERLCQSLVQQVIGPGARVYGMGKDGAREATFHGKAPYPSREEQWDGNWIFQAKFHDTILLGPKVAQRQLIADLDDELSRITKKYRHRCDNYILMSNVSLTPVFQKGIKDRIDSEIAPKYRHKIKNIHVWGAEEICRFLDAYPNIRRSYAHLLVAGDVISRLLGLVEGKKTKLDDIIKMYCQGCFIHEQSAVLDDAGDVEDEKIELERVFIDLDVKTHPISQELGVVEKIQSWLRQAVQDEDRKSALSYVFDDSIPDLVIIGGPGEGKSTLCQYVSQIHRARILGKIAEIERSSKELEQCDVRIPFRIFLREYAQWIASRNNSDSLFNYLAVHITRESGIETTSDEVLQIVKNSGVLLIIDGLDEVPEKTLRQRVLDNIRAFVKQTRDVLKGNLRVIATTRPHGYSEEFDPNHNLHLVLMKLSPEKAVSYAGLWIKAREPDPTEAKRIFDTFSVCLKDRVVNVLSQTPLQVTVLLVIIRARGTPPKQREELFERYMDIIYQREQKRRPELLRTEQDMIYGLHRYLAYLLHKKAESDETAALMDMSEFRGKVEEYVNHCNPLLKPKELETEVDQIITEAGTRLVLIESPQEGKVGFDLTTIREFFAAAHLVDTAKDTSERDLRFRAISKSPHWRNVSLFFAGRVGRTRPGEAASMIDMLRQIDTEGAEKFLKRGAELVVEMVDDRVLRQPHNEIGAIQYGLQVIDRGFINKYDDFVNTLKSLPKQYQSAVIRPCLEDKLKSVDAENLGLYVAIYRALFGCSKLYRSAIERASKFSLEKMKLWSLSKAVEDGITENWAIELLEHFSKISEEKVSEVLGSSGPKIALTCPEYLQLPLSHEAVVALTAATVKALERYHFPSGDWEEKTLSAFFNIDPRLKPKKNFLFTGSIVRLLLLINRAEYSTRRLFTPSQILLPFIVYPSFKKEIVKNAGLFKAFCTTFKRENDVFTKFFVSMFEFLQNPKDFQSFIRIWESNQELVKQHNFPRPFTSIFGSLPNAKSELQEFHKELYTLYRLYEKDQDLKRDEQEIIRLIGMRSNDIKDHPIKYLYYILAHLPPGFEKFLDENIVNSTRIWLQKRGLSMNALTLYRYRIAMAPNIDAVKFCVEIMGNAFKRKGYVSHAPILSILGYKWHHPRTQQETVVANQFKQISEKIIENHSSLDLDEDFLQELFQVMLTSGLLEEKHMHSFFKIFRSDQDFPRRFWYLRHIDYSLLKNMMQSESRETTLLAAYVTATILNERHRVYGHPLDSRIRSVNTSNRLWEIAKSEDHVWQSALIEGMAWCRVAWAKKHEELLQAIKEAKTDELLTAWVSVIRRAGYTGTKDRDALVNMLVQIVESESAFPVRIRVEASRRLYEVVSKAEPIGFDEKKLNLPLPSKS